MNVEKHSKAEKG